MFAVNGCWKRNSISTSLVAAAAAVADIHDCLYVCIGNGGGGGAGMSVLVMMGSINLKYCYHFTYNNWHLFPLHICFHLLHIYAPSATMIYTIIFRFIYYMTTFQKKEFCTWWPCPTPSEGPQNMKSETHLVNTFHLIYYMTTFIKPYCFALDDLAPPPRKGPKIWNPKPTRQDLSFDLLHDYLSKTLMFCTWWPCPTPSERPQNI